MDLETFRSYCLSKPGTTEELPFGPDTLVYKVAGKMFAATGIDEIERSVNLKCDPERAIELRERYEGIVPGWHMNKKHWNTVSLHGALSRELIYELIDHSYELVAQRLTKKQKE